MDANGVAVWGLLFAFAGAIVKGFFDSWALSKKWERDHQDMLQQRKFEQEDRRLDREDRIEVARLAAAAAADARERAKDVALKLDADHELTKKAIDDGHRALDEAKKAVVDRMDKNAELTKKAIDSAKEAFDQAATVSKKMDTVSQTVEKLSVQLVNEKPAPIAEAWRK